MWGSKGYVEITRQCRRGGACAQERTLHAGALESTGGKLTGRGPVGIERNYLHCSDEVGSICPASSDEAHWAFGP